MGRRNNCWRFDKNYNLHLDLWGEIIEPLQGKGYLTDVTIACYGEHPHYDVMLLP